MSKKAKTGSTELDKLVKAFHNKHVTKKAEEKHDASLDAILAYGEEALEHVTTMLGEEGSDSEDTNKMMEYLIELGEKAKPALEVLRAQAGTSGGHLNNFDRCHAAAAIAEIAQDGGPLCALVKKREEYNDKFVQKIAVTEFRKMTEAAAKACTAALPTLKDLASGDDDDAGSASVAIFSISGDGARAIEIMQATKGAWEGGGWEVIRGLRDMAKRSAPLLKEVEKMKGKQSDALVNEVIKSIKGE